MVVGEIGIEPGLFRHGLVWWEIQSIIKGYYRRSRDGWSQVRWMTYHVMLAQVGGDALSRAGVHKPSDLMKLPWDKEKPRLPSQETVKELQEELASLGNTEGTEKTEGTEETGKPTQ